MTGSSEGKEAILSLDEMLMAIFGLTFDENATVAKDAVLSLINLTAEEEGAMKVYELAKQVQPVSRSLLQLKLTLIHRLCRPLPLSI